MPLHSQEDVSQFSALFQLELTPISFHKARGAVRRAIFMEEPDALTTRASGRWVDLSQRRFLGLEELSYARPAQSQHLAELTVVEGRFLTRALQLDEFLGLGHGYVKVHLCRDVFHVAEVEHDSLIHNPD